MSSLFSEMATAVNLTRPDGLVAQRFVKLSSGEGFNWFHQDLRTDTTTIVVSCLPAADAQYLQGMLIERGWR